MNITRELLERYLRARREDAASILDRYDDIEPVGILENLLSAVPDAERKVLTIAFHLGLCAASEMDRAKASRLLASGLKREAETLRRAADDKLIATGITPEAWEAAR